MTTSWIIRAIAPLALAMAVTPALSQEPPSVPTEAPATQMAPPANDVTAPEMTAPEMAVPDMTEPAEAAPILPTHDLSPMGMYQQAHWVVKAVMIALLVACFVTWTIFVYKVVEMLGAKARLRRSAHAIRQGATLSQVTRDLDGRRDPASFMALAALDEVRKSDPAIDDAGTGGVKERVRSILDRIEAQAGRRMRKGTGILASVGSVAPFVGLFGTVWGIMNSFIGIAESGTTNLAVVAPGIAEALLATAIGLVAAIPAVVLYNAFARQISDYRQSLGDAGAGIERLVSRDLDFRNSGRMPMAAE